MSRRAAQPSPLAAWRRVLGPKADELLDNIVERSREHHRANLAARREARARLLDEVPRLENARSAMDSRTFNSMLDDIILVVQEAYGQGRARGRPPAGKDNTGRGDT